jgi:peptidoglycan/xylan/chitin deacetylase (PgdA/CDA1 family)
MNPEPPKAPLWDPYQGAVSLTFDDGTPNQLEKAVPALDEFGLKATFYLQPKGDDWRTRLEPWRVVAARGHEIGNHTLTHPCPGSILGAAGAAAGLEAMTLADIEGDIQAAQQRLEQLAPHQVEWTFAYPCYCTHVGRGPGRQSYVPVVARGFLAGRAGGEYGFGNPPAAVDLACAAGLPVERMSGYEMIGLVEEITARGHWAVLVFHEIDGPRLTVGSHDLRMLLNHLRRRKEVIWTAPVVEVARKIAGWQGGR